MIECIPEILKSVRRDIAELPEIERRKHYLELFESAIWIYLDNMGAAVRLESVAFPFKILDVLLCSSQLALRTMEEIRHDLDWKNWRRASPIVQR